MKRILICIAAITAALCTQASAAAEMTVDVRALDNFITISAELGEENANEQVTIEVTNSDDELNFIEQSYSDWDGNVSFSYYNKGDTGIYSVKVTAGESDIVISDSYTLLSKDTANRLAAIWKAKNSASEIYAATEADIAYLAFDSTYYDMLSDEESDKEKLYELYISDTEAKAENIQEVIEHLHYYTFARLCTETKNDELVKTMLNDSSVNKYFGAQALPLVDKKSIKELFDEKELKKVYSDIAQMNYTKATEVKTAYGAALLSRYIEDESIYANIEKALKAYSDAGYIDIDLDAYNKHKDQKGVITKLKKKDCSTYEKLEKAFDEALDEAKKKTSSGGGSTGSSLGTIASPTTPIELPNQSAENDETSNFTDMTGFDWAENAVTELKKLGVVSGISETEFRPMRSITRAEAVKMFAALFGLEAADYDVPFNDLNKEHWSYRYVAAAYREGMVSGKGENRFEPDATITRNEIIVLAYKFIQKYDLKYTNVVSNAFTDEVVPWAKDAATFCKKAGIIKGRTDNSFDGAAALTRAEAAVILYKVYQAENFSK